MEETTRANPAPDANSIAALIDQIVTSDWPSGEEEQDVYFAGLGFQQGAVHSPSAYTPEVVSGNLLGPPRLAIETASWASHKGNLFSINLFFNGGPSPSDTSVVSGYRFVYASLRTKYGQPAEETAHASGRASCLWQVEKTNIEIYCHVGFAPAIQIGVSPIRAGDAL